MLRAEALRDGTPQQTIESSTVDCTLMHRAIPRQMTNKTYMVESKPMHLAPTRPLPIYPSPQWAHLFLLLTLALPIVPSLSPSLG